MPTNSFVCSSLCHPSGPYSLPLTLLPEGGAVQWVRIPARDRQEGSGRGGEGEGDVWHQVEPREATGQPGFSQLWKRERRGTPTAAQGVRPASSALGRAGRRLDLPVPAGTYQFRSSPWLPWQSVVSRYSLWPRRDTSEWTPLSSPEGTLLLTHHIPASSPHPTELSPYS